MLVGAFAVLTRLPNLILSTSIDQVNPFVIFGSSEPSSSSLFFDIIILALVILIGFVLFTSGRKKMIPFKK